MAGIRLRDKAGVVPVRPLPRSFDPSALDALTCRLEACTATWSKKRAIERTPVGAQAEIALMEAVEDVMKFVDHVAREEPRDVFLRMFGCCKRIARIRVVVERVVVSDRFGYDTRVSECLKGCDSVDTILKDLGLAKKLKKALEEQRALVHRRTTVMSNRGPKLAYEAVTVQCPQCEHRFLLPNVSHPKCPGCGKERTTLNAWLQSAKPDSGADVSTSAGSESDGPVEKKRGPPLQEPPADEPEYIDHYTVYLCKEEQLERPRSLPGDHVLEQFREAHVEASRKRRRKATVQAIFDSISATSTCEEAEARVELVLQVFEDQIKHT